MTKDEIAGVLEQIATILELKAENPFKIRAYTNAARNFRPEFWNCFRCLGLVPRRSRRSTINSALARSSSCERPANRAALPNYPGLAKQRSKRFVTPSPDASRTPVRFNSAR